MQPSFEQLMQNVSDTEAFYFKDRELEGRTYRVFSYRLVSYSQFCLPESLEMRGITYRKDGDEWTLVCRPMEKFFNLNENPFTMNLNLSEIEDFQLKEDGSLISSFMHDYRLYLKSKTAFDSVQAQKAMLWLDNYPPLKDEISYLTEMNFTVNLEWCSPEEKIVIQYPEARLNLLNARNMNTGEYLKDFSQYPELNKILVPYINSNRPEEFAGSIKDVRRLEGYVVTFKSGMRVKMKTDWYMSLHRGKEDIYNPKNLFLICLNEGSDDLRSLFKDDLERLQIIEEMEKKVFGKYNHFVAETERFYNENKDLSQKDFAIKGQKELPKIYLAPVMALKNKKPINLKILIEKQYENFLELS